MLFALALACAPDAEDSAEAPAPVEDTGPPCADGELLERDGATFARLCARSFPMGCTPGAGECTDDEPAHRVTLTRDVWVGTTEVTQAWFTAVAGYNAASMKECDDCPVETMVWGHAAEWMNLLSTSAGLDACYRCEHGDAGLDCAPIGDPLACTGYRFPTEAEWEAAARCGEDHPWAGSDVAAEVAWTADNAERRTAPVATLAPNACGLYDLSGNVFEWTGDWYGPLDTADATDPVGAADGTYRSVRGGAWIVDSSYARVPLRSFVWPEYANYRLGFRVVRTAAEGE